jgi:hypothetical protein
MIIKFFGFSEISIDHLKPQSREIYRREKYITQEMRMPAMIMRAKKKCFRLFSGVCRCMQKNIKFYKFFKGYKSSEQKFSLPCHRIVITKKIFLSYFFCHSGVTATIGRQINNPIPMNNNKAAYYIQIAQL